MPASVKATLVLFLIAILWGLTFPFIAMSIKYLSPGVFVVCRLSLATLIFLPLVIKERKGISWELMKPVLVLGLFQGLCLLFQTISLETVPTANAAFLAASSVVMVPFLAPFFKLPKPKGRDYLAAFISAVAIAILTGFTLSFAMGDLWALGAAVAYALVINMLHKITQKHSNTLLITSVQMIGAIPLPFIFAMTDWHVVSWSWTAIAGIAYCAVIATCLVFYLQTQYQRHVCVTRAALIYAFEPLFATILAVWIQHQPITWPIMIGGSLLLGGFVISSTRGESMPAQAS